MPGVLTGDVAEAERQVAVRIETCRRHPTHPTTRRSPMRFNGLLAVGRRQVRQVGPHGWAARSVAPDEVLPLRARSKRGVRNACAR